MIVDVLAFGLFDPLAPLVEKKPLLNLEQIIECLVDPSPHIDQAIIIRPTADIDV